MDWRQLHVGQWVSVSLWNGFYLTARVVQIVPESPRMTLIIETERGGQYPFDRWELEESDHFSFREIERS